MVSFATKSVSGSKSVSTTGKSFPSSTTVTLGETPKEIFGYEVIDYIGEGAGSRIYVVSHPATKQIYALKHVVPTTEKEQRFVEQLQNEFEVGKLANHPGLRRCFDMKVNRNLLRKVTEAALVMELFDGQPLDTLPFQSIENVVDTFIQVGQALEALHQQGYVHCDLKPNNILMGAGREVKVIDLGQAGRVGTAKARIQGTPDYIAPEQVKCEAVTTRTDVYNLGATMYWALCRKNLPTLFTLKRGENSFLVDQNLPSPRDCNPQVPENLSNLVMECVRTNPAKRPEMTDVVRRLEIVQHVLRKARREAIMQRAAV